MNGGVVSTINFVVAIVSPVAIVLWLIVSLKIKGDIANNQDEVNRNINAIHTRLADDKAELIKSQTEVKAELVKNYESIKNAHDVHVMKDDLIQAQILEKLKDIAQK